MTIARRHPSVAFAIVSGLAAHLAIATAARAQTAARLLAHALPTAPLDLAISPDGRLAIVRAGPGPEAVTFYRLSDGVRAGAFAASSATTGPHLVAFAPDSASAVAIGGAGPDAVMFFNTAGAVPTLTAPRALDNAAHDLAIAPDGAFAVVVGQASAAGEGVTFYSLPGGARTAVGACGTVLAPRVAGLVAISPDRSRTIIATRGDEAAGTRTIQLWNTSGPTPVRLPLTTFVTAEAWDVKVSPDSRFAAIRTSGSSGSLIVMTSIATGDFWANAPLLPGEADSAAGVEISADASRMVAVNCDTPPANSFIAFTDTSGPSPMPLGHTASNGGPVRDVAISPDSRTVAVVTADLMFAMSLEPLFESFWSDSAGGALPARTADLAAFTPDSTRAVFCRAVGVSVASICPGAFRTIVPAATPTPIASPHQVVISPDGRFAAVRAGPGPTGLSFYIPTDAARFAAIASAAGPAPDASRSLAIAPASRTLVALGAGTEAVDIIRVGLPCRADFDANGSAEPADVALFVLRWFGDISAGTRLGDFDNNCAVEPADVSLFVSTWFSTVTGGAC